MLRKKWAGLAELRTAEARQIACDELFTNEEEEYSLYEAVKFLMLNRAIELYDDKEKERMSHFSLCFCLLGIHQMTLDSC